MKPIPTPFLHLFLAVPELAIDDFILSFLRRNSFIDPEAEVFIDQLKSDAERLKTIRDAAVGRSVFARILAAAPEALSEETVNLLRNHNLIGVVEGHQLRLAIRTLGVLGRKGNGDLKDIVRRTKKLAGIGFSQETVSLLRGLGWINVPQADFLRFSLVSGELGKDTFRKLLHAKKLADLLSLVGSTLIDERLIRLMKLAGVMNVETGNALISAISYGASQWTVWQGAKRAEGLAGRMAYVVSGSFSDSAMTFLKALNVLNETTVSRLEVAVRVSQAINRELMETYTYRRYRPVVGEAPIKTFARASKYSETELLRLLDASAKEAAGIARKMPTVRNKLYRVQVQALHEAMRKVYEGTGYLTIFGEKRAAHAATEALEDLSKGFRGIPDSYVRQMLRYQARAGLDAFISRQENTINLSRRVYRNLDLWTGKIDTRINMSFLQGKSAEELAKEVARFIDPSTPGGVTYSARRLARTEIANAFHTTSIRYAREQPWVRGQKWNLSGSHGRPDVCNDYADDDHDGLGAGVFKKANVPNKPHPQCLCYLTSAEVDDKTFLNSLKAGRYDQYFRGAVQNEDARSWMTTASEQGIRIGQKVASQIAITEALRIVSGLKEARAA